MARCSIQSHQSLIWPTAFHLDGSLSQTKMMPKNGYFVMTIFIRTIYSYNSMTNIIQKKKQDKRQGLRKNIKKKKTTKKIKERGRRRKKNSLHCFLLPFSFFDYRASRLQIANYCRIPEILWRNLNGFLFKSTFSTNRGTICNYYFSLWFSVKKSQCVFFEGKKDSQRRGLLWSKT